MTKVKLMLLMYFHLGLDIEDSEMILETIQVLDIAHELEPFVDGEEVATFLNNLLYPDGIPSDEKEEAAKRLDKAGKKWFWWVIEGRVKDRDQESKK